MIVTCPSCATRYIVDPAALGVAGRAVRCANCTHTWHQDAPDDLSRPVDLAPPPIDGPQPLPPGSNLPAFRQAKRRISTNIGWGVLLLVILAGAGGFILGRNYIVQAWPATVRLYVAMGLDVPVLGDGLDLRNVSSIQHEDTGTLVIEGTLINVSSKPREVPQLKAVVTSAARQVLKDWVFPAGVQVLLPGETAHFHAELQDVPRGGASLAVTFSEG